MTKRSLVSHACWAAIAMAAFGIGSLRDRVPGTGMESGPSATSKGAGTPRTGAMGLAGSRDGETKGTASARSLIKKGSDRTEAGESSSSAPLSEAALASLAREALKHGSPLVRRAAFGRLLESLTTENAVAIRKLLQENEAHARGDQWRDFHYAWGAIDGEAALKSAIASKEYDLAFSMSGWASSSPYEARRFLENLPDEVKTDRALLRRSLVAGMADSDTGMATNYVFELVAQGDQRAGELLGVVTSEVLSNQGVEAAVTWSENLANGPLKGAAMDRVAHAYVNRDPEAAAAWAQQFAGESYASRVIEEVGDEWAERDPVAAVNWLESLPVGEGQNSGLSSAFGEWAERDRVAAGDRLATMPRSTQRDYAINGYVRSIARRDPHAAIDWANSIAQDGMRNSALTRAGQSLFQRDAEAARNWVVTSGLPPEAQQQVLNPPKRR